MRNEKERKVLSKSMPEYDLNSAEAFLIIARSYILLNKIAIISREKK
jgi:hypothetical protein